MLVSARRSSRSLLFCVTPLLSALTANGQATSLGAEFRVNSSLTVNKDSPKISVANGGTFQAVWQSPQVGAGTANLSVRRFSAAGAPLAIDAIVNGVIGYNQSYPGIASLSSGGAFVVVWRTSFASTSSNDGIDAKMYDSSGNSMAGEFRVDTSTPSNTKGAPAVGADSSGNFVVVWPQQVQSGSLSAILGQRYNSSGTALGANFSVFTATTFTAFFQRPAIAVADNGDFVVTWDSFMGDPISQYDIGGQRFSSSGAPVGSQFVTNTYTTGTQRDSSIAMDSAGNFVVVWSTSPGGFGGPVKARVFSSSGVPAGNEFQVSASMSYATLPSVARFSAGSFVVSWADTGSSDVHARLFSSTGTPQAAEFQVNTYTTYNQYKSSVGVDTAGNFTVVWVSQKNTDSPTVHEIYGQRYCPALTNVSIALTSGSSNACPGQTAGTVTVTDAGGGSTSHQWGYRTAPAGAITSIAGQTAPTYVINTGDTLPSGTSYIVCTTIATCGGATMTSGNLTVFKGDVTGPVVTAPGAITTRQTLCQ